MNTRMLPIISVTLLMVWAIARTTLGQCQLANPSFELEGDDTTFAGWSEIGAVTRNAFAAHGKDALRVAGLGDGAWSIAGVWQGLDSAVGERWQVGIRAGHRAANPIVGAARGIVNVEFRDASDQLLVYDSFEVVAPGTVTDRMHPFTFTTQPAPAGTDKVRLVLAKLQSPAQDGGQVFFDHAQMTSLRAPTLNNSQWGDFPGGRSLTFADYTWRIKGPGYYGPGGSFFSDSSQHVWVDGDDDLHMTVRRAGGTWFSTEITLEDPLGYGDYVFTTIGDFDGWAPNVVFGFFLWQYPRCYDQANPWNLHGEFDLELSRWGEPGNDMGQFVCQPFDYNGNIDRFPVPFSGPQQRTSFAFRWLPDRVECRAWLGGPLDESPENLLRVWTYEGPHNPIPERERVHINFWQLNGPPSDGRNHEIVLDDFVFVPSCLDRADRSYLPCLADCLTRPGVTNVASCLAFDADQDGDIDLHDVGTLQRTPTVP